MAADFEKHGVAVIEECRRKHPVEYLQIISRLLPARAELDVSVDATATFAHATDVLQAFRLAADVLGGDPERLTRRLRLAAPHLLASND